MSNVNEIKKSVFKNDFLSVDKILILYVDIDMKFSEFIFMGNGDYQRISILKSYLSENIKIELLIFEEVKIK